MPVRSSRNFLVRCRFFDFYWRYNCNSKDLYYQNISDFTWLYRTFVFILKLKLSQLLWFFFNNWGFRFQLKCMAFRSFCNGDIILKIESNFFVVIVCWIHRVFIVYICQGTLRFYIFNLIPYYSTLERQDSSFKRYLSLWNYISVD